MYERIESLCESHGINITQMCKEAGVARAPLTELKKGRTAVLSAKNTDKIASFFNVPVGYLLGTSPLSASNVRDSVVLQGNTGNNTVSNGDMGSAPSQLTEQEEIVGIYRDEGNSARKPALKRPVMLELLDDVKAGKIDRILFIKLDRWFRNVREYHRIQEILEQHHVAWQATMEDYNTATADGRLKVNIMLSVAENEADRTSERIKFIFNSKLQKKEVFFPKVPLEYKIDKKFKR